MADEQPRQRLGRGLAALIGDIGLDDRHVAQGVAQRSVPIEFLRPNPTNPRKNFREDELAALAASIREKGIIQPILVRNIASTPDAYEIIAGERRWRAAQLASLHTVPIVLIEAGDKEALELAIIENVQRADLSPVEEALGYQRLISDYAYAQGDLARVIGKSRSHVANTLRLLALPASVRDLLADGSITAGHARALLSVREPEALAARIVAEGLSVRDVERVMQNEADASAQDDAEKKPGHAKKKKSADTRAIEETLTKMLGLAVRINHRGESGEVRVRYKSIEQLDMVCKRLGG